MAICMLIIVSYQPNKGLTNPGLLVSCIKMIALIWGIVKFVKIRFCWFFMPCCYGHGFYENTNRCCTFTLYRTVMLIVNIFHIIAIILVFFNIILYGQGGTTTPASDYPQCYDESF